MLRGLDVADGDLHQTLQDLIEYRVLLKFLTRLELVDAVGRHGQAEEERLHETVRSLAGQTLAYLLCPIVQPLAGFGVALYVLCHVFSLCFTSLSVPTKGGQVSHS